MVRIVSPVCGPMLSGMIAIIWIFVKRCPCVPSTTQTHHAAVISRILTRTSGLVMVEVETLVSARADCWAARSSEQPFQEGGPHGTLT